MTLRAAQWKDRRQQMGIAARGIPSALQRKTSPRWRTHAETSCPERWCHLCPFIFSKRL